MITQSIVANDFRFGRFVVLSLMAHLFVSCLCSMWDLDMTLQAAKFSDDDLDLQDYGDGK